MIVKVEILEVKKKEKAYLIAIHKRSKTFYGIKLIYFFNISCDGCLSLNESMPYDISNFKNTTINYIGLSENGNKNLTIPRILQIAPDSIQGSDLGSYCMRYIVKWAKENYTSSVKIEPICLHELGSNNVERRNGFYIRWGLTILPDSKFPQEDPIVQKKIQYGYAVGIVGDLLIPELNGFLNKISKEHLFELIMQSQTVDNMQDRITALQSCLMSDEWLSDGSKEEWRVIMDSVLFDTSKIAMDIEK